jgi:hypothetical protein
MTKIEQKSNEQPGIVITLVKIRAVRSVFKGCFKRISN